ncbi:hypothetical protein [Desulfogranum marinum]|uniref:hypothetical protein n=1 Tax=Desulfogranum marinum TaxID=453220 RepID=UPI0019644A43|nr:hypothetical protein [Desulfogranum marinum]MBM9511746.1 hypothetical protein [Desulfogranum marinum]
MTKETLPAFIQALLQPAVYSHPVDSVKLVQTHISYVLLAGDFVYKFKKPVNFGFLDFSDLEKRHFYCEQELTLNRRLCPEIYLDLVKINLDNDQFSLDGSGETVEYGIKMVRMPEEGMMGNMIKAGKLQEHHLDNIVDTLVPFYKNAATGEDINQFGTAAAVGVNVVENFEQTKAFVDQGALTLQQFNDISSYAEKVLAQTERFTKRIVGDHIRDCHGDLHSVNICLTGGHAYIYDCIEFNERFRFHDVACDVAFLAMDLDYYGLTDFSQLFIERFCLAAKDPGLVDMLDFYKCYRAYVRGKIGLFTAADPVVDAGVREECLRNAAKYFELAHRYAQDGE